MSLLDYQALAGLYQKQINEYMQYYAQQKESQSETSQPKENGFVIDGECEDITNKRAPPKLDEK
jgi:predicted phosphoadenosine phosphosulfate sulfurtransferase